MDGAQSIREGSMVIDLYEEAKTEVFWPFEKK